MNTLPLKNSLSPEERCLLKNTLPLKNIPLPSPEDTLQMHKTLRLRGSLQDYRARPYTITAANIR